MVENPPPLSGDPAGAQAGAAAAVIVPAVVQTSTTIEPFDQRTTVLFRLVRCAE